MSAAAAGYSYGDESGGFVHGGSQAQGSQSGEKTYTRDSLRPVTIKQILECEEVQMGPNSDFRIDGEAVTQLTFVAQVRQYNRQNTAEMFRLDDGTSMIEAKKFLSSTETNSEDVPPSEWAIDSWVRAYGRVKVFGGKRSINIHVVRPVESYNEVNYHMLEATMVHLYYRKQLSGGGGMDAAVGGGDGIFVDSAGDAQMGGYSDMDSKLSGASSRAKRVWKTISSSSRSNEGMRIEIIASTAGLGTEDALMGAQELMSFGVLYNTLDEQTFDIMDY